MLLFICSNLTGARVGWQAIANVATATTPANRSLIVCPCVRYGGESQAIFVDDTGGPAARTGSILNNAAPFRRAMLRAQVGGWLPVPIDHALGYHQEASV